MYANDETHGVVYGRRDNRRGWLAVGAGLVAVLVLAFLIVAACSARDSRDANPLGGLNSPSAGPGGSTNSGLSEVGEGGEDGQSGDDSDGNNGGGTDGGGNNDGGGNDGGGNDGGGDDGGGDDGDDGEPEQPQPLSIESHVNNPPVAVGCSAKGVITVAGGEYPMEVNYLWYRMQALPPHNVLVPLPFGVEQTLDVEQPGDITVTSPQFPDDAPDNRVMLVVTSEAGGASDWVTYPKCFKLGFKAP
jgi:hypothetical protein